MYTDVTGYLPEWAIAGAIVVGLAVATVATAGGAAVAFGAFMAASSGVALTSVSATTTILAFATLGAATGLASAIMLQTDGNTALVMTAGGGVVGTVLGTLSYLMNKSITPVIGKMSDLNRPGEVGKNEYKVADLLPDQGSVKANWKQNSSVLRSIMNQGNPIRDASPYPMQNAGFLGMERNLLLNHGWVYDRGYWLPPR